LWELSKIQTMSKSSPSRRKKSEPSESFDERVESLFEELAFAIQWGRPSILLAAYGSESARVRAELALEKRLAAIEQTLVRLAVSEQQFDIPLLLSKRPDRERCVYSVTGLSSGGGKEGANAYRALNIRREYFVDYSMRAVFWLASDEAIELARHAPDFWAFRHRLVEFDEPPRPYEPALTDLKPVVSSRKSAASSEELEAQVSFREALLAGLPDVEEALVSRFDLLYALGRLYQEKQEYAEAIKRLKQGFSLAQGLESLELAASFLGQLGLAYLESGDSRRAIRAYRKAIRLIAEDADLWSSLGRTYLSEGRLVPARRAFKKAVALDPHEAAGWFGLGQVYALVGRNADALQAYLTGTQLAPQDAAAWNDLGILYLEMGNLPQALKACQRAVGLAPQDARFWNSLGHVQRAGNRCADAIIAYQRAALLDQQSLTAHSSLIACYRLSGEDVLAEEQIKLARSILEGESEYDRAVFEAVCGNVKKAIRLLAVAIEKKQVGLNHLYRDPNLSSVRSDPNFQVLLEMSNTNQAVRPIASK
jgi:tetratricopeptide (TPR) repeat protein